MPSTAIPLHVVDDHNEVLPCILDALGAKKLKFEENMIIHFDSHPDLLLDPNLTSTDTYDKSSLLGKVDIETWLLPLAFHRHFTTIVWMKPEWSNQIPEGVYNFHIGEAVDGKIGVSSTLFYFISGVTYIPFDRLIEPKEVTLHVLCVRKEMEYLQECKKKLFDLIKRHESNYVLDIDLDFFSTYNPFLNMYENANMYERLKDIYKLEEKELSTNPAFVVQEKRKYQIEILEKLFSSLSESKNKDDVSNIISGLDNAIREKELRSKLSELISELFEKYENAVDWEMVHTAGTTIDDEKRSLPHHPSTEDEIVDYIDNFRCLIYGLNHPKMITMARSSIDDYCPRSQVNLIEEKVCIVLGNIFNIKMKPHYKMPEVE